MAEDGMALFELMQINEVAIARISPEAASVLLVHQTENAPCHNERNNRAPGEHGS
jgi:hypothetical protein